MVLSGKEIYGSDAQGRDIYKDSKGYYVVDYNPQKAIEYKKYLSKHWKPNKYENEDKIVLKCKLVKNKKTKKQRKVCKWIIIKHKTKKNTK